MVRVAEHKAVRSFCDNFTLGVIVGMFSDLVIQDNIGRVPSQIPTLEE